MSSLGSYFSSFWGTAKSSASAVLVEPIKNRVKEKADHEIDKFIQKRSKDIGSAAQKKFHEFLYKETELTGKVNRTGEEVTIYKTNPHLIQSVVKKITGGFDVENGVPLIGKTVFSKLDEVLVNKIGEYLNGTIGDVVSKAAISALYTATGAAADKIEGIIHDTKPSISTVSTINVQDLFPTEKYNLSDRDISDITKMFNHYIAKIWLYINDLMEQAATYTAEHYAGELMDTLSETVEKYAKVGIATAATTGATVLNPTLGTVVVNAIGIDRALETPTSDSYLGKFTKYALSFFWDKDLKKSAVEDAAHNKAISMVQKFNVSEKTLDDAYGSYKETEIDDLDLISIEQDEGPMDICSFLKKKSNDLVSGIMEYSKYIIMPERCLGIDLSELALQPASEMSCPDFGQDDVPLNGEVPCTIL